MNEETSLLRALLAKPSDATVRSSYAAWLEDRNDPRAQLLHLGPEFERISCVAWLEKDGSLEYYLNVPEVSSEEKKRRAARESRAERQALSSNLDPSWVAFIDTLACPFQPFFFFNNSEIPRAFRSAELPFSEQVGTRGAVVTFESDFRDETSWDSGLMDDLHFLRGLELGDCHSGAASCPVHPFLCQVKSERDPMSGSEVLAALRPRDFRSRYIEDLDTTDIPFPGYQPGDGHGIDNDEIHNDFSGQHIFAHERENGEEGEEDDDHDVDEFSGAHGALKRFVVDGKLWYVLLHGVPEKRGEYLNSRYVVLLAVGRSPNGNRLVGVITHQVCHNLCD